MNLLETEIDFDFKKTKLDFFGKYENKRFASLQHQLFKF
jgi:hypothetical protein